MANLNRPNSGYPGAPSQSYGSQPPQAAYSQPTAGAYGGQPHQPPYGSQQPPYGSQQPSYGSQQPPYNPAASQPTAGAYGGQPHQPPYGSQQPPYGSQQPPYGSQQPPYGSQQPSYGAPAGNTPFNMASQSQPGGYGQQTPYSNSYPTQQQQPPYGSMPPQQGGMGAPMGGMVGGANLVKGGNFSLTKAVPGLRQIRVGLGWDVRQTGGPAFDLDASCFLLKGDGRVRMPQDFVFYNNKQSVDGSVFHHGDNLTGAGEGDDESISIDLSRVPPEIQRVTFTCSIYEAEVRRQNFGMVQRAFIRVVDAATQQEVCRFDLTEEASLFNSMIFGEVYRYGAEWKFRAIGQGLQGGLRGIGAMYGLNLQ